MKIFFRRAALFLILAALVSCGRENSSKSENVWLDDFEEAKKISRKKKIPALLFVSKFGEDSGSEALRKNIFSSQEFIDFARGKFTLVNVDFSLKTFARSFSAEEDSAKAQKEAESRASKIRRNEIAIAPYHVDSVPFLLVVSRDGYFVSRIICGEKTKTVESVVNSLDSALSLSKILDEKIDAIEKARGAEKARLIDTLHEETPKEYRAALAPLFKKIPALDKANETGLVGKYIAEAALCGATALFLKDDFGAAAKTLADCAQSDFLAPSEKQKMLFAAANILIASQDGDLEAALDYLRGALAADETNPAAQSIRDSIALVEAAL